MKWAVELESRATGRKTIKVSRAENEAEAKERACKALGIKVDECSRIRAEQAGASLPIAAEDVQEEVLEIDEDGKVQSAPGGSVTPSEVDSGSPSRSVGPDEALDG